MSEEAVTAFVQLTGADNETAKSLLEASGGDMESAVQKFFDSADPPAAMDEEDGEAAADEAPALPSGNLADSILAAARQEAGGPPGAGGDPWAGLSSGRALGSGPSIPSLDEDAPSSGRATDAPPAAADAPIDRSNARKVQIVFWADGFTMEDVPTAPEPAPAAAPAQRRTGLATLRDEKAAEAAAAGPIPELPTLRKYEENADFMRDLQAGLPPAELREVDWSTGTPRARPVDIMLGDMRPRPFPADRVEELRAMRDAAARQSAPAKKQKPPSFTGEGRTLGGPTAAASADAPPPAPAADAAELKFDESKPTTTLQVRLHDGSRKVVKANKSHTVSEIKAHVATLTPGIAFTLKAGFPPKELTEMEKSLEDAGLLGEAIVQSKA